MDYYWNQDKWWSVPWSVKFEVSMMCPWRVSASSNGWCYYYCRPNAGWDYGRVKGGPRPWLLVGSDMQGAGGRREVLHHRCCTGVGLVGWAYIVVHSDSFATTRASNKAARPTSMFSISRNWLCVHRPIALEEQTEQFRLSTATHSCPRPVGQASGWRPP